MELWETEMEHKLLNICGRFRGRDIAVEDSVLLGGRLVMVFECLKIRKNEAD